MKASGVIGEGSDSFLIVEEFEAKKTDRQTDRSLFCQRLLRTIRVIHKNKRENTYQNSKTQVMYNYSK